MRLSSAVSKYKNDSIWSYADQICELAANANKCFYKHNLAIMARIFNRCKTNHGANSSIKLALTSQSALDAGPTVPRMRSSSGTCWMKV